MHTIEYEFNEVKEGLSKLQKVNGELKQNLKSMGDQLSKMKSLNESLVKEVKNLKQGNISKCKKDEEIYR